jgi:DnaJ-class molecular chaperone
MSAASLKLTALDLAAALTGKSRPLTTCPHCNGTGLYHYSATAYYEDHTEGCAECDATGQIPEVFDEDAPSYAHEQKVAGAELAYRMGRG